MRMKKYIISAVLLLLFCGVSCSQKESKLILIYNDKVYEPVYRWYMIDEVYEVDKAYVGFEDKSDKKANSTVFIYTNAEERFILSEGFIGDIMFHMIEDPLPDYKDIDFVEKVAINLYSRDEKTLILEDEKMTDFLSFIATYGVSDELIKAPIKNNLAAIYIYYKDYPAYYFIGHLVETKDNKLAFYKLNDSVGGLIDEYMGLPDDLQQMLGDEIKRLR